MRSDDTVSLGASVIRRAVLASIIGNGFEWYDFLMYGFFARTISRVFFPAHDAFASLMLTYASFAIGFLVRPLGGLLLGALADRVGRQRTLSLLIVMMAIGTVVIAVTPGYAQIGMVAPIVIVAGRVLQGLSTGGEFGSATAMLVEYAPPGEKFFYGSFQMCSQAVGILFAALTGYVLTTFVPHGPLEAWVWRVPFLVGTLIGPMGFYIRRKVAESPEFERLRRQRGGSEQTPIREVVTRHAAPLLCAVGFIAVGTANNYIFNTYLPVYVVRQLHLSMSVALLGATVGGIISVFLYPVIGRLADRSGPYRIFFGSVIAGGLLVYPVFEFVVGAPSAERLFVAQVLMLTIHAFMIGTAPGLLAALFPTQVRSTGMSLSYNVAVTLFGGFAPVTVTWLIHQTGSSLTPAFYLLGVTVFSLVVVSGTLRAVRSAAPLPMPLAD
jgi:MFS transporter, MHS family, proline/betaine transporter